MTIKAKQFTVSTAIPVVCYPTMQARRGSDDFDKSDFAWCVPNEPPPNDIIQKDDILVVKIKEFTDDDVSLTYRKDGKMYDLIYPSKSDFNEYFEIMTP